MEDVIVLSIAEIVDGVLLHAQKMLDDETYDWPSSRAALERILADLEAQSFSDSGIERLRGFIAAGEEVWKIRQENVWWFLRGARFSKTDRGHWWRR